ncbi:MAG: pyridoxal phosphate-dependent aminotransferase [Candidatus Erginobacter occultus]|nr:pyridoxal phosphate-dependent aminotransferase [Candidatus Erginobacter occultus]
MLTKRTKLIDASGIRKVFELGQSVENPINLSIGQPHFDVPQEVQEAAISAIRSGRNAYTLTQGLPSLNKKVMKAAAESVGREFESSMITCGVSGGLVLAFMALVEPGDEVLCPDPYFVMYKHLINLFGGKPVYYDTYPDFIIRGEKIEPLINERTKLIIVSSPANPTGAVHSEEELQEIARIAKERDIFVVSDEIYALFSYDDPHLSMASYADNCLLLGGFSKSHSLTGWRLGFALGPRELLTEMTKLQQYTFVCAPSFAQEAALAAMDIDTSPWRNDYRKKRDLVYSSLKEFGYRLEKPGGAFYIFPECPWGTDEEFTAEAIKNKLLIIPGSVFSERNTHFRISYAAEDETIRRGLEVLKKIRSRG